MTYIGIYFCFSPTLGIYVSFGTVYSNVQVNFVIESEWKKIF